MSASHESTINDNATHQTESLPDEQHDRALEPARESRGGTNIIDDAERSEAPEDTASDVDRDADAAAEDETLKPALSRLNEMVAESDFAPEAAAASETAATASPIVPEDAEAARPGVRGVPPLTALFTQLGHGARGDVTEVRATSPGGEVSVGMFGDADAFAREVGMAIAVGSTVTVGAQPRPVGLHERAPDRLVVGAAGAKPENIAHVTTLAVGVEPAIALPAVVAEKYTATAPLTAIVADGAIVVSAVSPVTVTAATRDAVITQLRALGDVIANTKTGATVRFVDGLADHVDVTQLLLVHAPARVENTTIGAFLAIPNATHVERGLIDVRLDMLVDGTHFRGDLDAVDVSDLVASLPAGQTCPIIVRPLADGHYLVLAGHRRVRAARKLGWSTLRAEIRRCDDDEAQRVAIDDALARRDLPAGQQARAIARRKELYERAHPETVAGASGKGRERGSTPRYTKMVASMADMSESAVQRMARLGAGACDEVIEALDAGDIRIGVAVRIAALALSEQPAELAAVLAAKGAEKTVKERRIKTAHAVQAAIAKAVTAAREDDEMLAEGMLAATRSARDFFSAVVESLSEPASPPSATSS